MCLVITKHILDGGKMGSKKKKRKKKRKEVTACI
jgi:hypothetical protein